MTEGKHCTVCGTVTVEQKTVPVLDHTYDNDCDKDCNVCTAERSVPEHSDANGDTRCDVCDEQIGECTHMCHNDSWFVRSIIWPFVRFILKLFGGTKPCACGVECI